LSTQFHSKEEFEMPDDLAIEATGLTKSYSEVSVLRGIDVRVPRGSVFALLGPNGAGKTTTVRILATLTQPDGGHARVAGHDVVAARAEVRRRISVTGQYAALDEPLTGFENLEMIGRLLRFSPRIARARARDLLAQFDLLAAADRRVGTYSGGMRRRLDLAASLIAEPEVIFLDEPTTGLDPRSRHGMWELVNDLTTTGVSVFLTSQYLDEADRLADRIAVLDGGRIVAEGSAEQLKQQVAGRRLEIQLVDLPSLDLVAERLGDEAVHVDRSALTVGVATDGAAADVRRRLDELDPERIRIERFEVRRASLDDVFLSLTGHVSSGAEQPSNPRK
jgi:ABC-2 type transport system ATP-binding protein